MRIKNYLLLLFLTFYIHSFTQNLVPNPSFEDLTTCEHLDYFWWKGINFATPWFGAVSQGKKSNNELYNKCSIDDSCLDYQYYNKISPCNGVPRNYFGYQYARTGNGYAFFREFNSNQNFRSYMEVPLLNSLIAGKKYTISFYISLTDISLVGIDAIGACVTVDSLLQENGYFTDTIIRTPEVSNPQFNIIMDTTNWTKISGNFIAKGGEKFLTIGVFVPFNNIHFNCHINCNTLIDSFGVIAGGYYIDDVALYESDAISYPANAGLNKIICSKNSDSIQIGTAARDEYLYYWKKAEGMREDDTLLAMPRVKPSKTTTYYLRQKDFKFDETKDSVVVTVVNTCTGMEKIKAFPNPTKKELNIVFYGNDSIDGELEIFNMLGKLQKTVNLKGKTNPLQISISDLAAGIYLYRITKNSEILLKDKLVIIK